MLVLKIDVIGLQAPERLFGHPLDTVRAAGDSLNLAVRGDVEPELGGDNHPVAHRRQGLAGDLLAKERPIDFGDVEERNAPVIGRPDDPDRFLPIGRRAIHPGEVLAAHPQGRNLQRAEPAALHARGA
jgi:hypothetical protein